MKTLILTAALVVSATLTFAQKAGPNVNNEKESALEAAVLQPSNDKVVLMMEKTPYELVKVRVYDGKKLLHSQRVRKEATARITYDISSFPDGEYTLSVIKDKEVVYSATIHKDAVSAASEESRTLADIK